MASIATAFWPLLANEVVYNMEGFKRILHPVAGHVRPLNTAGVAPPLTVSARGNRLETKTGQETSAHDSNQV